MKLKLMSLLPGFRYSSVAAGADTSPRLTVDAAAQIPRKQPTVTTTHKVPFGRELHLDLVTPKAPGKHPLVVYVPGGGFVVSPRGMAAPERAFIAAAGYAVASVEYRTVRQAATYLDGMSDVVTAIDHLVNSPDYPIDGRRVGVWGESAGGYLASMVGLTDPRVRAVVDEFGASDVSRIADGFDLRMREMLADPKHPIHRYGAAQANPVDHIGGSAPAFLLLHGDDDRIIAPAQTLLLHQALQAAGATSTRYLLAGAGHGKLSLSGRQARQWTSVLVMTIIKDFLDLHLRS